MQNTATDTSASNSKRSKPRTKPRRRPAHTNLDARTWQYKLLQATKADLLRHIGPSPSVTQIALANRAAWLTLHLAEMDAKATAGEILGDFASRQYLAWTNSLSKTLRHLGLKGAAEKVPTLAEHKAARAAAP